MTAAAATFETLVPRAMTAPRGAQLVGIITDLVAGLIEHRRAAQSAMRRAQEADAVRNYAYSIQASDPGMAADLLAAADRHFS